MSTQVCKRCGQDWPLDLVHWKPDKDSPNGLRMTRCRKCQQETDRESRHQRDQGRPTRSATKTRSILVLSDVHHPEHDRKVWATLLEMLKDMWLDEVILLGDFLEMASVSMHGGAELEKLTEDFEAGKKALREIREAVGADCKITYLEGNHESRLTRFLWAKAPSLRDTLTYEKGLDFQALDIEWVPEAKQPITRGDLDLTHGHQDLRERPSKFHSGKMAEIYGRPDRTVMYGHTHKPQLLTRPTVGGYATAIGLGCARTLSPGWLHGSQAGWVHQIAVVYLTPAGRSYVYPITFRHGQTVWNGKFYGAMTSSDKEQ